MFNNINKIKNKLKNFCGKQAEELIFNFLIFPIYLNLKGNLNSSTSKEKVIIFWNKKFSSELLEEFDKICSNSDYDIIILFKPYSTLFSTEYINKHLIRYIRYINDYIFSDINKHIIIINHDLDNFVDFRENSSSVTGIDIQQDTDVTFVPNIKERFFSTLISFVQIIPDIKRNIFHKTKLFNFLKNKKTIDKKLSCNLLIFQNAKYFFEDFIKNIDPHNFFLFKNHKIFLNKSSTNFSILEFIANVINCYPRIDLNKDFLAPFKEIKNLATQKDKIIFDFNNKLTVFSIPINWNIDPYNMRIWRHNFNKLLWLNHYHDLDEICKAINDFYLYNVVSKKRNLYFNTRTGDHATCERIGFILDIIKKLKQKNDIKNLDICLKLLNFDINSLLNPEIYSAGANHGLMADICLLQINSAEAEYLPAEKVEFIFERGIATLEKMFGDDGVTREHSISYQEFNLDLAIKFCILLSKNDKYKTKAEHLLKILPDKTKQMLAYFLKEDGNYFSIGDSHRLPMFNILNKVFKKNTLQECLAPYYGESGIFWSRQGFLIYRNSQTRIHLSFVSSWNSVTHKQNDDLSFCLAVGPHTIFDDCGYTGFVNPETAAHLRRECCHSTIILNNFEWNPPRYSNNKSFILYPALENMFRGEHQRMEGVKIKRTIIIKNFDILVEDNIEFLDPVCEGKFSMAKHRFVLNPEIDIEQKENLICLLKNNKLLCTLEYEDHAAVQTGILPYAAADRTLTRTKFIDIRSNKISHQTRLKIYPL